MQEKVLDNSMTDYNKHIKEESERQQYWVEYYKRYNIEYTSNKGFK